MGKYSRRDKPQVLKYNVKEYIHSTKDFSVTVNE